MWQSRMNILKGLTPEAFPAQRTPGACEECLAQGNCLGCSSRLPIVRPCRLLRFLDGQARDQHFHETQHPVMRANPPAAWTWCYVHDAGDARLISGGKESWPAERLSAPMKRNICLGDGSESKSDARCGSSFWLRRRTASSIGSHVCLHHAHDHPASLDHMDRPAGGPGFLSSRGAPTWFPPSFGYGSEYRKATKTSICHASAGSCWILL